MKTVKKNLFENIKVKFKQFLVRNKPVTKNDWIRIAVLAIAVPVFIYSSSKLVQQIYTYIAEDRRNQAIIDMRPPAENPFDEIETEAIIDDDNIRRLPYKIILGRDSYLNEYGRLVEYQELWERNNDMVGWFFFPGLPRRDINYPLLQAEDNIFYLNYDFDKNRSYSGSIYMDYRNNAYSKNPLKIDRNYIITGHAMKDFSMFGSLSNYWSNERSQENARLIYVDLMNTRLQYEVFSSFVTYPEYNYKQVEFADDKEYLEYILGMKEKSTHDFGVELSADDKIVTLETCYLSDRRTVIVGRLIKQIIYEIPESETGDDLDIVDEIEQGSSTDSQSPDVTPVRLPDDIPQRVPFPTATPPAEDTRAAERVIELIDSIVFPVTPGSKSDVQEARKEYELLTSFQKTLVDNYDDLVEAEKDLKTAIDKNAAEKVIKLISSIPSKDKITLEDKPIIEETRKAYNELTRDQQKLVNNKAKLDSAIKRISELEDKKAAEIVTKLINELPPREELKIDDKPRVMEAKNAYEILSENQKKLVNNKAKLDSAIKRISELEDKKAAEIVTKLINELPPREELKIDDKPRVMEAKNAYEILSENQKKLVNNKAKLDSAINRISELEDKKAADTVISLINDLPGVDEITLEHEEAANKAYNEYNKLTDNQKELVTNKQKLSDILKRIDELKSETESQQTPG